MLETSLHLSIWQRKIVCIANIVCLVHVLFRKKMSFIIMHISSKACRATARERKTLKGLHRNRKSAVTLKSLGDCKKLSCLNLKQRTFRKSLSVVNWDEDRQSTWQCCLSQKTSHGRKEHGERISRVKEKKIRNIWL